MPSPPKPWETNSGSNTNSSSGIPLNSSSNNNGGSSNSTFPPIGNSNSSSAPTLPNQPGNASSSSFNGSNGLNSSNGLGGMSSSYNSYGSNAYGSGLGSGYGTGYGSSYSSGLGSYGSRYGSMGGYGGYSSYGGYGGYGGMSSMGYGGMSSMGYGGMGGYGGYGSRYGSPYGMGSMYGNRPMNPNEDPGLAAHMQLSTQSTFQLLERVVGTFGGIAQMLESTYFATHSSFMAMVGVAEQFGMLKHSLSQVFSIVTIYKAIRNFIYRHLGLQVPVDPKDLNLKEFKKMQAQPKFSYKPFLMFAAIVFGIPYLLHIIMKSIARRMIQQRKKFDLQQQQLAQQNGTKANPTYQFAQANFEFSGQNSNELNFKKGDLIAILNKSTSPDGQPSWWQGRLRDGKVGMFPSNYVEVLEQKPDPNNTPISIPTTSNGILNQTSGLNVNPILNQNSNLNFNTGSNFNSNMNYSGMATNIPLQTNFNNTAMNPSSYPINTPFNQN